MLTHWRINDVLVVKKSPTYWDADQVRLREIRFYPIESFEDQERAFRAGQLHVTYEAPLSKIDSYKQQHPELIHVDPYLGTYIYRLNVTKPPLNDKRVRRALAMALDRVAIATKVRRAGEAPAYCFTPPRQRAPSSHSRMIGSPSPPRSVGQGRPRLIVSLRRTPPVTLARRASLLTSRQHANFWPRPVIRMARGFRV